MSKRSLLVVFTISLSLLGPTSLRADVPSPPNIVLILADDLGWTDLGATGSRYYETPHLDHFFHKSTRFDQFYMCQNCAPSRAALFSGQYAPRTGIYTVGSLARGNEPDRQLRTPNNETNLSTSLVTLADSLKTAGYTNAIFGKWHLGEGKGFHPRDRGFDETYLSGPKYFDFKTKDGHSPENGAYLTDYVTDLAIDFLRRQKTQRFFLYLPHNAVHTPIRAKKDAIEHFKEKQAQGGHHDPVYAAMIQSLDQSVGRILAALEELELAQKTLVLFTSDNGGLGGYTIPGTMNTKGITDNAPLRGGKGTLYEGGIRVPFAVRWPGVTPAGATCSAPAVHVDLYPTLLEAAGGTLPKNQVFDGISLIPQFRSPLSPCPERALYWHFPGYLESYIAEDLWRTTPVAVIRRGDYKYLEYYEDGRQELYHLGSDKSEKSNLITIETERANSMRNDLRAWQKRLDASMPSPK